MQKKGLKLIPKFKNEDEERDFWASHDTTEYFDYDNLIELDFSHLKFNTKPVTIRLPISLLDSLKRLANRRDVPYQSLMKVMLAEKADEMWRQKLA